MIDSSNVTQKTLFAVVLRYLVPLEKVLETRPVHLAYLNQYYDKGIFLISGPQVPRSGGFILARAENRSALMIILEKDPFYIQGIAEYQVYEFEVNMCARELSGFLGS